MKSRNYGLLNQFSGLGRQTYKMNPGWLRLTIVLKPVVAENTEFRPAESVAFIEYRNGGKGPHSVPRAVQQYLETGERLSLTARFSHVHQGGTTWSLFCLVDISQPKVIKRRGKTFETFHTKFFGCDNLGTR